MAGETDGKPTEMMPGDAGAAERDEAVALLESLETDSEEEQADEPAPDAADEEEAEAAPADDAEPGEDEESEEGEDGKDDEEEDEESKSGDDKPKKKNRYQRMKGKVQRLEQELESTHQEATTLRTQYEEFVSEARQLLSIQDQLEAENTKLREALKEAGYEVDPRESELSKLKAEIEALKKQPEKEAEAQKRRAEVEREQHVQSLARKMRNEAEELAEDYGLEAREILTANMLQHDIAKARGQEPPSLREIAAELAELERYRANKRGVEQRGRKKPAPPPRSIKPGAPSRPRLEGTVDEAVAFLDSLGLD